MHGCHTHIDLLKISWFGLQMNGLGLHISNLHLLYIPPENKAILN